MQCAKFEQRLQQLLDDRQDVEQDAMLQEHSRRCEACSAALRTQHQLLSSLRELPAPRFGQELGVRVLDQLRLDQRKRSRRQRLLACLAIAATVLIALLPWAGEHAGPRPDVESPDGALALVTPHPRPLAPANVGARQAEDLRLWMQQLIDSLTSHRLAMFEPVDQLASGIRPLAMTLNFAFDTLRRTLPGYTQPQPADPQARYPAWRTLIS